MLELSIGLRTVHVAATVALAGGFAFLLFVARPAISRSGQWPDAWLDVEDRLVRIAAWCSAVVLASGILWFLVQSVAMNGGALADVDPAMLASAASGTLFGRVAVARLALVAMLGVALFILRRTSRPLRTTPLAICAALAAALLATLAGTGHAAAEQGAERMVHLSADAMHLLAAGMWLGALPVLAWMLALARRATPPLDLEFIATALRGFSALGITAVSVLVLTGALNAWYTIGSVPALIGTQYGRLLCAKVLLFAGMLALAALNRWRWTPCVSAAAANPLAAPLALARLRRNALAETALGLAVLGVVGVLGVTVPGVYVQPLWPLSYTLDWDSPVVPRRAVVAALIIVAAGLVIVAAAAIRLRAHRLELVAAGGAMAAAAVVTALWLSKVPAHPTTYLQSPVPYSVTSIARGAPLYGEHCAACHGTLGYGDGPAAASLPTRPPYLTSRLTRRREGDLVWSLGHRTSGICTPAIDWANEAQLWDLFNYLRALAYADVGRRLDAAVEPWRPVAAPDFTFQIGRGVQESLAEERGRHIVLLVLYSSSRSLPRLRALADSRVRLERLGVRVIAVPMTPRDALPTYPDGVDASMMANPDAHLARVYSMFTRTVVADRPAALDHLEFLIDRQGYLRARSIPGKEPGWAPEFPLLRQAVALNREKSRAPAPLRHGH